MIGYEVELRGVEEQLEKLGRYPQSAQKHLTAAMYRGVIAIEGAARGNAPVGVSGHLRRSLASSVKTLGAADIEGKVGTTLREVYPAVMEFGRQKGVGVPPRRLERWVRLRLGVPQEEVRGVAIRVARAIRRKGIKGRKYLRKAWQEKRAAFLKNFEVAVDKIAQEMVVRGQNG